MTSLQKVKNVFEGLLMLIFGLLLALNPEDGYQVVTLVLGISLIVKGIQMILYYFSMARHMVGGRDILFRGIVFLDLGLFTGSLTTIPQIYVIAYLLVVHAVAGAVDVLRALEAKRLEAGSWRKGILTGVLNLAVAVACVCCLHNIRLLTMIYSLCLIWSAGVKIVSALRKTAIVYIP